MRHYRTVTNNRLPWEASPLRIKALSVLAGSFCHRTENPDVLLLWRGLDSPTLPGAVVVTGCSPSIAIKPTRMA